MPLCCGHGHRGMAMVTVPQLGTPQHGQDTATARITVLFQELLSYGHRAASVDGVPWAGVECPCKGHHALPVSPGSGKGCRCCGPESSRAVGRRAMPWPWAQGGHLCCGHSPQDKHPFSAQPHRKGGCHLLGTVRGPAARRALRAGTRGSRGEGLAAAPCCCTPLAGARKGK